MLWRAILLPPIGMDELVSVDLSAKSHDPDMRAAALQRHRKGSNNASAAMWEATVVVKPLCVVKQVHNSSAIGPAPSTAGVSQAPTNQACTQITPASLLRFRQMELERSVRHIRAGLHAIVPLQLLRIFPEEILHIMVLGQNNVSAEDLRRECEYGEGVSADDSHVKLFWQVLTEDFAESDRVAFLKFVSGRTRLPPPQRRKLKHHHLKIKNMTQKKGIAVDEALPFVHTCFFEMELPRYTSRTVMRKKIGFAIKVRVMDGDNGGVDRDAFA